jgi:hypothetical protein
VTVDHQTADAAQRRTTGLPVRLRANSTTILCGLWVAVIVLAVAIDLAK